MKHIIAPRITTQLSVKASDVNDIFNRNTLPWHDLKCCNWPESFPYTPTVRFRLAHTGSSLLLQFAVSELTVRATEPIGGKVWEDSCCETFISFNGQDYYNLECNACGSFLIKYGPDRSQRMLPPERVFRLIDTWSSLGSDAFNETTAPAEWQLALAVPVEAFFGDNISSLSGIKARINFYKCGDCLANCHFLSWAPVTSPAPDFHRPQDFGAIEFAELPLHIAHIQTKMRNLAQ